MEQGEIERVLTRQQIDTTSLALILSREEERIYELMMPEADAIARWRRLREALPEHGYWPVVGWGARWFEEAPEYRTRLLAGSTHDILAKSETVDPEQWMAAQERDWLETMQDDAAESGEPEPADAYEDMLGEWPQHAEPNWGFAIPRNVATREPVPRVPIALVPAAVSWQVPAVLRLESGYASSAIHVAMARRWHDQYGAEIVGMLPDLLEMHVARPAATRAAAEALAKEQFLYCADIVIQGTQTLLALAAGLLHSTAWYFWWD